MKLHAEQLHTQIQATSTILRDGERAETIDLGKPLEESGGSTLEVTREPLLLGRRVVNLFLVDKVSNRPEDECGVQLIYSRNGNLRYVADHEGVGRDLLDRIVPSRREELAKQLATRAENLIEAAIVNMPNDRLTVV